VLTAYRTTAFFTVVVLHTFQALVTILEKKVSIREEDSTNFLE
jgi:hypothetical protein